jgi:ATP-binding cassette subfamily F protein 3
LLLDEPTNHLDAASREELENTLLEYGGTLLIISHDRYFINKLADRILALDRNGVKEYLGNYDYYREHTGNEEQDERSGSKKEKQKPVNEYFLKKQRASEERKRQTRLKKTEAEIERLDAEISDVEELLSTDEVASDYEKLIELTNKLEELNSELENQYEIWEELSDQ